MKCHVFYFLFFITGFVQSALDAIMRILLVNLQATAAYKQQQPTSNSGLKAIAAWKQPKATVTCCNLQETTASTATPSR